MVPLRDSNLAYQIVRYITVNDKEPDTAGHEESNGGDEENTEETDDDSDDAPAQQSEISEDTAETVPESSEENTDEGNVLSEDVSDNAMLFSVVPSTMQAQRSTTVSLEQGERLWYPSHWGTYSTSYFYRERQNSLLPRITKGYSAKCGLRSNCPGDKRSTSKKVLYYGYGGPGDISASLLPGLSNNLKYIYSPYRSFICLHW